MTVKQAKKMIEDLADEIDEYLAKLERGNKDDTDKYHALFYLSGGLRELAETED